MNFPILDYSTASQSNHVVVLAGGPSTGITLNKVQKYMDKFSPIVIAANYNYGVKTDYTYYVDMRKFQEQYMNSNSKILLRAIAYKRSPEIKPILKKLIKAKREIFLIGSNGPTKSIYPESAIQIDPTGRFQYTTLGACGFGAIVASLVFRPTHILFTGIDGPIPGTGMRKMWDGTVIPHKPSDIKKDPKIIRYFKQCLFESLKRMNIKVQTFSEVYMYGLNKKTLHIEVIE